MKFDLECSVTTSKPVEKENLAPFFANLSIDAELRWEIKENKIFLRIISEKRRSHEWALRIVKKLEEFLGRMKIGVRDLHLERYEVEFELDKEPMKSISIPFADVEIKDKNAKIVISDKGEEFLRENYVDRIIKRINEKISTQYYEGKKEYWNLIWQSKEKKIFWDKDPSEEMIRLGWIKLMGKGKWFYFPPAAAIMRAMERIAINEVIAPLGFSEIIQPMHVSFDTWIRTGHLEGMPGEIYYICEPKSREAKEWENFVDLLKIRKEVSEEELIKNLKPPKEGVCYAQCPNIYASLAGKTIAEDSLPLLIFDRSTPSDRYEAGGKHGIERVDEFHRIEIVYIGTKEQLIEVREKLMARYRHVFDEILDLEWRMAKVTPFYLQQAGLVASEEDEIKGTIDFEAYLPYRGDRSEEWLEIQNISIVGDKYVKAFNIKAQKSDLWSGCSGIGLERWTVAFLAQKGIYPENWPERFRKYLPNLSEMPKFL
ncbi:MAG: serine--tRNA ligase [Thermoplasmatales archaeon]|nr:serine--tRNA ligase [Thermoplasmatales archaeon]